MREYWLDPPESSQHTEDIGTVTCSITIDLSVEIDMNAQGNFTYVDATCPWADSIDDSSQFIQLSDQRPDVTLDDKCGVIGKVDGAIANFLAYLSSGRYRINANIVLPYEMDGLSKYSSDDFQSTTACYDTSQVVVRYSSNEAAQVVGFRVERIS